MPKPEPRPLRTLPERAFHARARLVAALMCCVCFAGLAARLAYLQLFSGDWYTSRALGQQLRDTVVPADRGRIYSDDGVLLAANSSCWTLRASPREMPEEKLSLAAQGLAEILELDEAALLDGCTRFQVFHKIIIPICKPMIVYQAIIGFLTPWLDFVMAKVICRTQSNYTVALGLWLMLQKEYIQNWFARFAAAAVVISVPIAILFIVMQRFYQESMSGSVKG